MPAPRDFSVAPTPRSFSFAVRSYNTALAAGNITATRSALKVLHVALHAMSTTDLHAAQDDITTALADMPGPTGVRIASYQVVHAADRSARAFWLDVEGTLEHISSQVFLAVL
jgi:hypothetical protein